MELQDLLGNLSYEEVKAKFSQPPYSFTVKEDGSLFMLSYNQIESDFSLPAVKQARGIIFEKGTNKLVCHGFDKFFNVQESKAARIDWSSAQVQEKIDGSLIKYFFYGGQWRVATNNMIDAFKAPLVLQTDELKTFGDLFIVARGHTFCQPKIGWTYMFEVVSPHNRVVVPYKEPAIYFIGVRNDRDEEEDPRFCEGVCVDEVKQYSLSSMERVIDAASKLPFSEEGYVVVDKYFNRVKVKSPAYVAVHNLRSADGKLSNRRLIELVITEKADDFLSYYPEFKEPFDKFQEKFRCIIAVMQQAETLLDWKWPSRKEFAIEALKTPVPSYLFSRMDGRISASVGPAEFLRSQSIQFIERLMGG